MMKSITKFSIVIVLAMISMIFAGVALASIYGNKNKEEVIVVENSSAIPCNPNDRLMIFNGKVYKILDGGLYQDVKTQKVMDSRGLQSDYLQSGK